MNIDIVIRAIKVYGATNKVAESVVVWKRSKKKGNKPEMRRSIIVEDKNLLKTSFQEEMQLYISKKKFNCHSSSFVTHIIS